MSPMESSRIIETVIVISAFLGYLLLWRTKRRRDIRQTGVDPEVLHRAASPVQAYFAKLLRFLTAMVIVVIVLHSFAPDKLPPLVRLSAFSSPVADAIGGLLCLAGLCVCALAQAAMGASWRVGIDIEHPTSLITSGIYKRIRNPTYLGLHLMNLGLWTIWPTTLTAAYGVLFFIIMEIQVRAEEEHLHQTHGETYRAYAATSRRYIPWIY